MECVCVCVSVFHKYIIFCVRHFSFSLCLFVKICSYFPFLSSLCFLSLFSFLRLLSPLVSSNLLLASCSSLHSFSSLCACFSCIIHSSLCSTTWTSLSISQDVYNYIFTNPLSLSVKFIYLQKYGDIKTKKHWRRKEIKTFQEKRKKHLKSKCISEDKNTQTEDNRKHIWISNNYTNNHIYDCWKRTSRNSATTNKIQVVQG